METAYWLATLRKGTRKPPKDVVMYTDLNEKQLLRLIGLLAQTPKYDWVWGITPALKEQCASSNSQWRRFQKWSNLAER